MQGQFIGQDYFPDLAAGDSEFLSISGARYLIDKTGVTLASAEWSSSPAGVTFSTQSESDAKSTVLAAIPAQPRDRYDIRCKMTFSDGAIRTYCAPLRTFCE